MPLTQSHNPGRPAWVDCSVATSEQRERLMQFLSSVFGWLWSVGPAETGNYSMALHDGQPVFAVGENEYGTGVWTTYFCTADIESSIAAATDAGASVLMPAMQVMQQGHMALLADPSGAVFGLWQPIEFAGFGAIYEIGTPGWWDHVSADANGAASFYERVLGKPVAAPMPGMRILMDGEDWYASLSEFMPGQEQAMWNPIYLCESLEHARAAAVAAGGTVIVESMDVPGSEICVIQEPVTGGFITVMRPGDQPE